MPVAFAYTLAAAAGVLIGLIVEFRLFAPAREPRRGEAIAWSIGWLALAAAAATAIALAGGPVGAWTTVYLIERSLSLDNVFLFTLLLAYFAVPSELRGRVVIVGIVGALLLRGVAIVAGLALVEAAEAVIYVFGVLLLYVAYRAFRGTADDADPQRIPSCVSSGVPCRPRTATAAAGCSCAWTAVCMARRCCSRSSRSSPPTSPSPSTRSRPPSSSPATQS